MGNKVIGSIPYSLGLRLAKPGVKNSGKKIVPVLQSRETVDKALLAQHMREHGSSLSQGTLEGIITDLSEHVSELLQSGYSVLLDHLGRFHLTASATGVGQSEDFSTSGITLNVRFTPADELLSAVRTNAEFSYEGTREEQAAARKAAKEAADAVATPDAPSGSGSGSGNGENQNQGGNTGGDTGGNTGGNTGGDTGGDNSGGGGGYTDDSGFSTGG